MKRHQIGIIALAVGRSSDITIPDAVTHSSGKNGLPQECGGGVRLDLLQRDGILIYNCSEKI